MLNQFENDKRLNHKTKQLRHMEKYTAKKTMKSQKLFSDWDATIRIRVQNISHRAGLWNVDPEKKQKYRKSSDL